MSLTFSAARFLTSAYELDQLPPDDGAEVAFAGRSNAGKSSSINCLVRQQNLCKTSKTPGRTQLINFFEIDASRRLVDLPGYGYAKVPQRMRRHWDRVLSGFLLERRALRGLVIVVDIRRGIGELDQALISLTSDHLPLHILLTKADKLSRNQVARAVAAAEATLGNPAHGVSSLSTVTRQGLDQLEQRCRTWLESHKFRSEQN